jgi:hypothetical protein
MQQRLVRLSKVNSLSGFPFRKSTLYKWVTLRKHPSIFVKIGGARFVDLNALDQLIESGRGAK